MKRLILFLVLILVFGTFVFADTTCSTCSVTNDGFLELTTNTTMAKNIVISKKGIAVSSVYNQNEFFITPLFDGLPYAGDIPFKLSFVQNSANEYKYSISLQNTTYSLFTLLIDAPGDNKISIKEEMVTTKDLIFDFTDITKAGIVYNIKKNNDYQFKIDIFLTPGQILFIDPLIKAGTYNQELQNSRRRLTRTMGYGNILGALTNSGAGDINFFQSNNNGQTWSAGTSLISDKNTNLENTNYYMQSALLIDDQNYFNAFYYSGNPLKLKYKRCLASTDCSIIGNWSADTNIAVTMPVWKETGAILGFDVDYNLSKTFNIAIVLNEMNDNAKGSIAHFNCKQSSDCTNSTNWTRDANIYANTELRVLGKISLTSGTNGSEHLTLEDLGALRNIKYFTKPNAGNWTAWSDINVGQPGASEYTPRSTIKLNKSNEPQIVFPKFIGTTFSYLEFAYGGNNTTAWTKTDVNNIAVSNGASIDIVNGDRNWSYLLFNTADGLYYTVRYDKNTSFTTPVKINGTTNGAAFGSFNGPYLDIITWTGGTKFDFNSIQLTNSEKQNSFFVCDGNNVTVKIPLNETNDAQIFPFGVDIAVSSKNSDLSIDTQFCLPPGTIFPISLTVSDSNGSYFSRSYFVDANATLQPYLVPSASGSVVIFSMVNELLNAIPGVLMNISKNINGTPTTMTSCKTDISGLCSFPLIAANLYDLNFFYNGINVLNSQSFKLQINKTTYYFTLNQLNYVVPNVDQNFAKVVWTPPTEFIYTYSTSLQQTVSGPNVNFVTEKFYQYKDINMMTGTTVVYLRSLVCNGSCNITTLLTAFTYDHKKTLFIDMNVYSDTNTHISFFTKRYSNYPTNLGMQQLCINAKKDFGCAQTWDSPCPLTSLASVILTIFALMGIAFKFGFVNPSGMGILALFLLGIFTYLGWFFWIIYAIIVVVIVLGLAGRGARD